MINAQFTEWWVVSKRWWQWYSNWWMHSWEIWAVDGKKVWKQNVLEHFQIDILLVHNQRQRLLASLIRKALLKCANGGGTHSVRHKNNFAEQSLTVTWQVCSYSAPLRPCSHLHLSAVAAECVQSTGVSLLCCVAAQVSH